MTEPETFEHMLTVVMIMAGDDRERDDDTLWADAFEYGMSWFRERQEAVTGLIPPDHNATTDPANKPQTTPPKETPHA